MSTANKAQAKEWFDKGEACMKLGGYGRAIDNYDKAIKYAPDNPEYHSRKGVALFCLGRVAEAIECYERAVELEPNNGKYEQNLHIAMEKLNIFNEVESVDTEIYSQEEALPLLGQNNGEDL